MRHAPTIPGRPVRRAQAGAVGAALIALVCLAGLIPLHGHRAERLALVERESLALRQEPASEATGALPADAARADLAAQADLAPPAGAATAPAADLQVALGRMAGDAEEDARIVGGLLLGLAGLAGTIAALCWQAAAPRLVLRPRQPQLSLVFTRAA